MPIIAKVVDSSVIDRSQHEARENKKQIDVKKSVPKKMPFRQMIGPSNMIERNTNRGDASHTVQSLIAI